MVNMETSATQDKETAQKKKRDINDKENRCQWVSNNILTTYTTVL